MEERNHQRRMMVYTTRAGRPRGPRRRRSRPRIMVSLPPEAKEHMDGPRIVVSRNPGQPLGARQGQHQEVNGYKVRRQVVPVQMQGRPPLKRKAHKPV